MKNKDTTDTPPKDITSKASKIAAVAQKAPSMAAFFAGARPLRIMRHNGLSEVINAVAALPDPKEPVNIVVDLGAATGDITKPWFRNFREALV